MIPIKASAETQTIRNLLIGLAGGAVLVAAVIFIYNRATAVDFKKLNDSDWRPLTLGAPVIAFESPVDLIDTSRPPNEREREVIKYQMQYTYKGGSDVIIVATVVDYHPHVYIDPMAPEQSVKGFEFLYQATNITYESTSLTVSNYPAKRISGRFLINDKPYVYARVNVIYKSLVRDLLVIVPDGNADAGQFLDRMLSSVAVE